jgi:hypothetical protein
MSSSSQLFCPRCATENGLGQRFCRQCGQSLYGIQWVLDGNLEESQRRLTAADKWFRAGNSTLIAFISIAIMIAIIGVAVGNPTLGVIAMINVLTGAVIGLPLVFVGTAKLIKAKRLASKADVSPRADLQGGFEKQLPAPQTSKVTGSVPRSSVTEHTTLNLANSGQNSKDQ